MQMNKRLFVTGRGSVPYDETFVARMLAQDITVIEWSELKQVTTELMFGFEVMGSSTSNDLELLDWTVKTGGFLIVPPNSIAHDWCRKSSWDMWFSADNLSSILTDQRFCAKYAGG